MKMHVVVALVLVGCGGSPGGVQDMATPERDFSHAEFDFSMEHHDFAVLSTDMSRSIEHADMGKATAPPTSGTNSTGGSVSSTIGSVIGGIIGAILNNDNKSGNGSSSGGGQVTCPADLDVYGYCYNNTAVWCDDSGTADAEDCGANSTVCSYACPGYEGYAACCTPTGSVSTCVEGCEGTVLTYCTGNTSNTYDCSQNTDGNTACGLDSNGYMSCVQSMDGACDGESVDGITYYGVTYQGICDSNVVIYCDTTGTLQSIDCGDEGETCTWIDNTVGYSCQ